MSPADPSTKALNLALEEAINLHTQGDLDRAQAIYREVLAEDGLNALALHYLGIYFFQTSHHEDALAHMRLSCELVPENSEWKNDLGNVLFAIGQFEQAVQSYQSALQLSLLNPTIWNNLGSAHLNLGDHAAAIEAFEQAIEIMPEFGDALTNLGALYESLGNKLEGSIYQCRAFVLQPHEGKSKQMLGICFYFLGRLSEAADIYRSWLDDEPGQPIAEHMYAACTQSDVPHRASDGYVEKHFDTLAQNFDVNLMENLGYGGPWLVEQGIASIAEPARQFDILDIGCGTGLCAPSLAPYAWHMTGVDLSGEMLNRAQATHLYDVLKKQEITNYLQTCSREFDIVVACDTLIYFGDLEQLFLGVAKVLKPSGYFIFTTESIGDAADLATYRLHASGRYRHAETYVNDILSRTGHKLRLSRPADIREEAGTEVEGTLVVVQRL